MFGQHTIGIIGGGQLGGLLTQFPSSKDLKRVTYKIYSPTKPIFPSLYGSSVQNQNLEWVQGGYNDDKKMFEFGKDCHFLTYELENISVAPLKELKRKGVKVYPDPEILEMVQDKKIQKEFLLGKKFPVVPFVDLENSGKRPSKVVQKLRRGGYDGQGIKILPSNFQAPMGVCLLEKYIEIEKELAMMVGRNEMGEMVTYPTVEVISKDFRLDCLISPAEISPRVEDLVRTITLRLAEELGLVGVMAVEFFLEKSSGKVYINEISPRPHNTGHHTLEDKEYNQFALLNRCLLNLSLKDWSMNYFKQNRIFLINVVGKSAHSLTGNSASDFKDTVFNHPSFNFWSYNKTFSRPGRKLGHLSFSFHINDEYDHSSWIHRLRHSFVSPGDNESSQPYVSVIMGSISDLKVMNQAVEILNGFGVPYEVKVVSAHRSPHQMIAFGKKAEERGVKVIIAGAGGAAHLPGMVASTTSLPVIGVPIRSSNSIQGIDSLLSIGQMPGGIPVATMAINGAKNAGLMATRILGVENQMIRELYGIYREVLEEKVDRMNEEL